MTTEQVAALGPAFTGYLGEFRHCFVTHNTFGHLGTYCRGLLSDLPRKSVEPIALAAGCAVRTLQEFLTHHAWDHERMRDELQRRVAREHLPAPGSKPAGGVGTVGWIDETSVAKKGDKTPGVQRQYCGASGKVDNCVVTVHLACRCGDFAALLDADLFLPEETWDAGPRPLPRGPRPRPRRLRQQVAAGPGAGQAGARQRRPLRLADVRRVVRRQARVPRRAGGPGAAVRLRGAQEPAVLPDHAQVPVPAAALRRQTGGQRRPVFQAVQGQALEESETRPPDAGPTRCGRCGRPRYTSPATAGPRRGPTG